MRPESHRVGDLAETLTQEAFLSSGWIVNRCLSDYGYDFFVMRDPSEDSSPGFAFLQVKGHGGNAFGENSSLCHVQVKTRHLRQWYGCPVPVFLCIVHVPTRSVYVVSIKEVVGSLRSEHGAEWASAKSRCIMVTTKHLFSPEVAARLLREIEHYWMIVRQAWLSSTAEGAGMSDSGTPRGFPFYDWLAQLHAYLFQRRLRKHFGREGSCKLLGLVGLMPIRLPIGIILKITFFILYILWPTGENGNARNSRARKDDNRSTPNTSAAPDGWRRR